MSVCQQVGRDDQPSRQRLPFHRSRFAPAPKQKLHQKVFRDQLLFVEMTPCSLQSFKSGFLVSDQDKHSAHRVRSHKNPLPCTHSPDVLLFPASAVCGHYKSPLPPPEFRRIYMAQNAKPSRKGHAGQHHHGWLTGMSKQVKKLPSSSLHCELARVSAAQKSRTRRGTTRLWCTRYPGHARVQMSSGAAVRLAGKGTSLKDSRKPCRSLSHQSVAATSQPPRRSCCICALAPRPLSHEGCQTKTANVTSSARPR